MSSKITKTNKITDEDFLNYKFESLYVNILKFEKKKRYPNIIVESNDVNNIYISDRRYGKDIHIHVFLECKNQEIAKKVGYHSWQLSCRKKNKGKMVFNKRAEKGHYPNFKLDGKDTIGYWIYKKKDNYFLVRVDTLFKIWSELLRLCNKDLTEVIDKSEKSKKRKEDESKTKKNKFAVLKVDN